MAETRIPIQSDLGWRSVLDFGAKRASVIVDAAAAAGSTSVSSPSGRFTPAMNGKYFVLERGGPVLVTGVDAWEASPLIGTFTYVSATTGTLSSAAVTAVTGGRLIVGESSADQFDDALSKADRVHIPPNSAFIVDRPLRHNRPGCELVGSSQYTSRLYSVTARANVIESLLTADVSVHNLTVYGNGYGAQPANTFPGVGVAPNVADSGCGILMAKVTRPRVTDVTVRHCGGDGVTSGRNGIAGIYFTHGCRDGLVARSRAYNCRNGINEDNYFSDLANQEYASPVDNTYADNITNYCRFGMAIDSGSLSRGADVVNPVAKHNVVYGLDIHSSKHVTVVAPRCSYNGRPLTGPGIQVYGTSATVTCENITIIGPICFANGTHGIKVSDYVKDWKIIGGELSRNNRHGLYVNNEANDFFVIGTSSRRNGAATDNPGEYDGIRVTSSRRGHIQVNSFDDASESSETATQNWGVRVDGTSDSITVDESSKFYGNLAGSVKLSGANSRFGSKARSVDGKVGNYLTALNPSVSTAVTGQSNMRAAPMPLSTPMTFDRISIEVTTAAASSTVRLGIYADTGDAYPGALVLDAGAVDSSTTGVKELTINQRLEPGMYWLASVSQGGDPTVRVGAGIIPLISVAAINGGGACAYLHGGVTGALPSQFSSTVSTGGSNGRVFLRRSA